MRPIQETMPQAAVTAATPTAAIMAMAALSISGRRPMDLLTSSSRERRVARQRMRKRKPSESRETGAIVQNLCQPIAVREPMVQKTMSGSWDRGSATYFTAARREEKKAETAKPARMSLRTCPPNLKRLERKRLAPRASKAMAKEQSDTKAGRADPESKALRGVQVPATRARAAPKAAPWDTPRNPASTRGLPKMVWKAAPEPPSTAPRRMAPRARGSLMDKKIL